MSVRLSRGRWSASLGSVCLAPISLVLIGVVLLAGGLAGCGGSTPQVPPQVPALSISTASLASGQVGAAYTASLNATGGTAPYQWSLRSGSLPAGLTFSASSA